MISNAQIVIRLAFGFSHFGSHDVAQCSCEMVVVTLVNRISLVQLTAIPLTSGFYSTMNVNSTMNMYCAQAQKFLMHCSVDNYYSANRKVFK